MFECSVPPPLSDEDIDAVLDGVADETVLQHLTACAGCHACYKEAQNLDYKLRRTLYRWDCPSAHQLGEYALGIMDAAQQKRIAQHLETCSLCRQDVNALNSFSQFIEEQTKLPTLTIIPPNAPSRRVSVATVNSAMAAAPLRGKVAKQIIAEVGDTTIFLNPDEEGDTLTLTGQVVDIQQERWGSALLELRQMNQVVGTAILDDLGEFVCRSLPTGKINLAITSPDGYQILLNDIELVV